MNLRRPRTRALLAAAAVAVLASATPASAHAQLTSTEPVGGTALAASPSRVVLHFGEAVEIGRASMQVFASPSGRQVETGPAGHLDGVGSAVSVSLPKLDRGGYIVAWRVTSADAHPIHGAFTFTVGPAAAGGADAALVAKLLASGGGSTTVGALYAVVRFVAFSALVLLAGGFAFVVLVWPAGVGLARPRRLLWGAWGAAFAVTVAGIPLQAVYAAGLPLSKIGSSTVLSGLLDERFGKVWGARVVLLTLMGVVLWALRRGAPAAEVTEATGASGATGPAPARVAWPLAVAGGLLGAGLLLTPGLAGHASTQDLVPLALASDLAHLVAVALWLGGLAMLVVGVLPRRRAGELAVVVPRFSRIAFAAVVAILATGTFQGWREVRNTAALTETTYGRLLIVKVVLFGLMVGLGGLSRRLVQARYRAPAARLSFGPGTATADPEVETVSRLRRSVGAETVVAVVVLAVTSLLVNAQPARSALARPHSAEMRSDAVWVDVTVDPAKAGPSTIHLYTLSPSGGGPLEVQDLTASLSLPNRDVGPLAVRTERSGPGHFSAYNVQISLPGRWTLQVKALLSDIDEVTLETAVPVR